jgi:tRNA-specific 2-thiouridylase
MAKDKNKDQSYFLSFITPEVLDRVLFPVGDYTKPEVRMLAKKFGLPNAERKESQGICFIGKVDFGEFLKTHISQKEGNIVDKEGNILGKHQGVFLYTLGQRQGRGLSGGPLYVVGKNPEENVLIVSKDERDLLLKGLSLKNVNWFSNIKGGVPLEVETRIRYRQTKAVSVLSLDSQSKRCKLVFKEPQRAIAPGQLAVFYQGEQMLGGGVIE